MMNSEMSTDLFVAIIAAFAYFWVFCPRTPIWKTKWWEQHINRNLEPNDPRMD